MGTPVPVQHQALSVAVCQYLVLLSRAASDPTLTTTVSDPACPGLPAPAAPDIGIPPSPDTSSPWGARRPGSSRSPPASCHRAGGVRKSRGDWARGARV